MFNVRRSKFNVRRSKFDVGCSSAASRCLGILTINGLLLSGICGSELKKDVLEQVQHSAAMPSVNEEPLGKILERYYKEGLGGPEAWEAFSSVYIAGRLKRKSGEFQLTVCRKKPNYMKRIIADAQSYSEVVSNGESAWQVFSKGGVAKEMKAAEKRRFIHDARFGSYLLYPYASGKQIEYIDTVPANGSVCHLLKVELETGYQIEYFIDVHTHLMIKAVTTDLHSGEVYSLEYSNYSDEFGIPLAQRIVTYENGEWASTLEVDVLKVNVGMMPWMFDRPE